MQDPWLDRWNQRFKEQEFAYGKEPNAFFKNQIEKLKVGSLLLGAEGEGRNAVYAANKGWEVSAFDISEEGKNKALKLASEVNVTLDYQIGELPKLTFQKEPFDAIALIYAHFPPHLKSEYHRLLSQKLKKGGTLLLEAFSKNHLAYQKENPKVGGPSNLDALFSIEEIQSDFENYEWLVLEETVIELNEGLYHNGKGSVIRVVAQKTND